LKPQNLLHILIPFICIGLLLKAQATPGKAPVAPETALPGFNTADGDHTLFSLTNGVANTAVGWYSLKSLTTGSFNTGMGAGTLVLNSGNENTGTGAAALLLNSTGTRNTANGTRALLSNTSGSSNTAIGDSALSNNTADANTAIGDSALLNNTTGGTLGTPNGFDVGPNTAVGAFALGSNTISSANTAVGYQALGSITTGFMDTDLGASTAVGFEALANATGGSDFNSAFGYQALFWNTTGFQNTAIGTQAMFSNDVGYNNVAIGDRAMINNTAGRGNIALGFGAGFNITGNNNVCIGLSGESSVNNSTYIANINTTAQPIVTGVDGVTVDLMTGRLGHGVSSRRYKEDIKPMDKASEALFALKPVMFRYKKQIDPTQGLDYGLIAEDVARLAPELAIPNGKGEIENVRYQAINAMLLNEFLKVHKRVEEQAREMQEQKSTISELRKGLGTVIAQLKEQASEIQNVSAQFETSKPASKVVVNNQ
jgi:Chaperone of endosialidase